MPSTPSSETSDPRPPRRSRVGVLLIAGAVLVAALGVLAVVAATGNGDGASSARDVPDTGAVGDIKVADPGIATVGSTAPDFTLRSLDGRTVRLADLRGRPVVVNFWASWCTPCRKDFPVLKKAWEERGEPGRAKDLAILGVLFRDIRSDVRDFARDQGARWTMLDDPDRDAAKEYGVRSVPTTLFIDRDGVIRARYFGAPTTEQFDRALGAIS